MHWWEIEMHEWKASFLVTRMTRSEGQLPTKKTLSTCTNGCDEHSAHWKRLAEQVWKCFSICFPMMSLWASFGKTKVKGSLSRSMYRRHRSKGPSTTWCSVSPECEDNMVEREMCWGFNLDNLCNKSFIFKLSPFLCDRQLNINRKDVRFLEGDAKLGPHDVRKFEVPFRLPIINTTVQPLFTKFPKTTFEGKSLNGPIRVNGQRKLQSINNTSNTLPIKMKIFTKVNPLGEILWGSEKESFVESEQ